MLEFESLIQNLLHPPILFFVLGVVAVWLKSDLDIAQPIPRFLSLLLLATIGLKGGTQLAGTGLSLQAGLTIVAAVLFSALTPLYSFALLRLKFNVYDAAAVAAAFGSVSAITFITADSFLEKRGVAFGGHMVAAMALMESPAIVVGLLLVRKFTKRDALETKWRSLLHEALCNGSVIILLGSFAIGWITGAHGATTMKLLTGDLFPILLAIFLLDMGLVAGRRMHELIAAGAFVPIASIGLMVLNATLAIGVAALLGISEGDALLFTVLVASASYIAVPATMRVALPEANPGIYLSMALAVVFPINILIGIPLYMFVIERLWS
jgi:hypothetical protein